MRVLLAGFEPFGGEAANPSVLAVSRLAEAPPSGIALSTLILPVAYGRAWPDLLAALRRDEPELLLLTGLAGGRSGLSFERVALNLDDGPIADNEGERRRDVAVIAGGPAAYFTTAPARDMAEACAAAGVPATLSTSAGTFLCNHVLYRACHHAATERPRLRCGFLHLPFLPEQAARHEAAPSLTLEAMTTGLRAALEACESVYAATAVEEPRHRSIPPSFAC